MRKYNLFFVLYVFFVIYNPQIFPINSTYIIGFIAWLYILFHKNSIFNYCNTKELALNYLFFLVGIIYALLLTTMNVFVPKELIVPMVTWAFCILPACMLIRHKCLRSDYSNEDFIELLLIIGNLQGIIAVTSFLSPGFRTIIFELLRQNDTTYKYLTTELISYRYYGISMSLITYAPVVQSILAIIAFYMFLNYRKRYIFYIPLLLFSSIINARSSIILLFIGMICILLFYGKITPKKIFLFITIIFVGIFGAGYFLQLLEKNAIDTFNWLNRGVLSIIMFTQGEHDGIFGYFMDNNQWKLPSGINLLFGKGKFIINDISLGAQSDIGYVNYLWLGGVIYFIGIQCYFFRIITKIRSNVTVRKFISFYLLVSVIIFNIKMPVFIMNEVTSFIFLLYVFWGINKTKIDNNLN